jgi:hypothetical protein
MSAKFHRAALWAVLLALGSCWSAPGTGTGSQTKSADREAIVGDYDSETRLTDGRVFSRQATVALRDGMLNVTWRSPDGDQFEGVGIRDGRTLGVAYFANSQGSFRGGGVAVYNVTGGHLEGTRLSYESAQSGGGYLRETLQGPPGLEGRYEIAANENTFGQSFETGYVEIARKGDLYELQWYTPAPSLVGNGIRLGDKLVVGYANGFSLGVVAYCVDHDVLTGVNAPSESGPIGISTMRRHSAGGTSPSRTCKGLVESASQF